MKGSASTTSKGDHGKPCTVTRLMTMIAYGFLQQRRLKQAQRQNGKEESIVGHRNQLSWRGEPSLLPSRISQRCRHCRMRLRLQWKSFCQSKR
jgi:hypothetical protein